MANRLVFGIYCCLACKYRHIFNYAQFEWNRVDGDGGPPVNYHELRHEPKAISARLLQAGNPIGGQKACSEFHHIRAVYGP